MIFSAACTLPIRLYRGRSLMSIKRPSSLQIFLKGKSMSQNQALAWSCTCTRKASTLSRQLDGFPALTKPAVCSVLPGIVWTIQSVRLAGWCSYFRGSTDIINYRYSTAKRNAVYDSGQSFGNSSLLRFVSWDSESLPTCCDMSATLLHTYKLHAHAEHSQR